MSNTLERDLLDLSPQFMSFNKNFFRALCNTLNCQTPFAVSNWCSGSTSDFESESAGSIPVFDTDYKRAKRLERDFDPIPGFTYYS